jgi:hypothetical protein
VSAGWMQALHQDLCDCAHGGPACGETRQLSAPP